MNIETFVTKQYINTNKYSWERNRIYSTLPYDIILKNNNNIYYDYGNDELDEKFKIAFNINTDKIIKTIEGIKWDNWIIIEKCWDKMKLANYYNIIMKYFKLIIEGDYFDLPNDKTKFEIKQQSLIRYKKSSIDPTVLLLDIELLLYRNNKPLARHLKLLVISNGIYINIIMIKVIGVINECNIVNKYETLYDEKYYKFEPEFKYKYDMNSFIYDTNEKLVHSSIEYNLYNKLLKEL
jgi:hypothetical protein